MIYLGKSGVIHRGIRSSRVLVSGNGRVQLADFRLSGASPLWSPSSISPHPSFCPGTILDRLLRPGHHSSSLFRYSNRLIYFADSASKTFAEPDSWFWVAPEVLAQDFDNDSKADVWSLGILMYELAFGKHPFSGMKPIQVCFKCLLCAFVAMMLLFPK